MSIDIDYDEDCYEEEGITKVVPFLLDSFINNTYRFPAQFPHFQ